MSDKNFTLNKNLLGGERSKGMPGERGLRHCVQRGGGLILAIFVRTYYVGDRG